MAQVSGGLVGRVFVALTFNARALGTTCAALRAAGKSRSAWLLVIQEVDQ
ncbi:hypothetical protein [Nevskia soli]|nr:hypothetical protein [Nevskia soli]